MSMRPHVVAAAAIAAAVAFSPAPAKDKPIGAIVAAGHRIVAQGLAQGDFKMAASVYAPRAAILPPNEIRIEGRDAIERRLAEMGKSNFEISAIEVRRNAGTAWCTGTYKLLGAQGKQIDVGKFVEIWVQTDQGWKIWRDIWNSDNPAPSAK